MDHLTKLKSILRTMKTDPSVYWLSDIENVLKSENYFYAGKGTRASVYIKKNSDYVVKVSEFPFPRLSYLPKALRTDTLPYLYRVKTKRCYYIVIQQKAEVNGREDKFKAMSKIHKQMAAANIRINAYDIWEENVGWYKGRPVIIDWGRESMPESYVMMPKYQNERRYKDVV